MGFKFTSQKLLSGLFEPEGIYLTPPFEGEPPVLQAWGEFPEVYGQWRYNGVPLKGHPGIDVRLDEGERILAMDAGKVVEISVERGGFERYVKVEHRWGESLYGHLGAVLVEAGQSLARGEPLAEVEPFGEHARVLHFAIRIQPYNRYDGWGGFSDPLPYMPPGAVLIPDDDEDSGSLRQTYTPHDMADDRPGLRRP
jgi:murein DD-endopeptidase MepM/ murein hydrolase activator NlpD